MKKLIWNVVALVLISIIAQKGFASPALSIGETHINVTCPGGNDGAIHTIPTGGASPYIFLWNDANASQNRSNLIQGTYSVTVTDNLGATASVSINITQPAPITIALTPVQAGCAGGSTGGIFTNVSGGTAGYTYLWAGPVVTQNRINIPAGNYTVTVTDAMSCTASASTTVAAYTPMSFITSSNSVACYGGSSGSISVTPNNGTPGYTYLWNNGKTTSNIDSLPAGNYRVTVTDAHSCSSSLNFNVNQPTFATVIYSTVDDVQCYGDSTGDISLNVANGTLPYNYLWDDGSTGSTRSNLKAGNYEVTVTDGGGCVTTATIPVNQSTPIVVVPTVVSPTCFGMSNGAVNLNLGGGFPPYKYRWSTSAQTQNIHSIPAGIYSVTVTDNLACTVSASATVTQPALLTGTVTATNSSCFGSNDGTVTAAASGGTMPYLYHWNGIGNGSTKSNLSPGKYYLTITDGGSCTYLDSIIVTQPQALAITQTQTNVVCYGNATGNINITVTGGTTPYSYDWGNNITTRNRTNIAAGTYTVTATDNNGCTITNTSTITQPQAISLNATQTNISCNGGNTGAINTAVTGGVAPYMYNWGSNITTPNRSGLALGNYSLTVTDNTGCTAVGNFTITQQAQITINATKTNVSCFGGNNGAITLNVSGGISPLNYNWGNGITTQNRTALSSGNYSVTVTDNANCSASAPIAITQPQALVINETHTNVSCAMANSGSIQTNVTGGTTGYQYNWAGGINTANRSNLSAGNYQLTVTDTNACTTSITVNISNPNSPVINATKTDVTCNGLSNGSITLAVSAGAGSYTYNWGNGITTQNRNSLNVGNYNVTVTDALSCSASAALAITQPAVLTASVISTQNATCFGSADAGINISASGGTGAYNYLWSNHSPNQNLQSVLAGAYSVTVTDANQCTTSLTTTLTQPNQINISTAITNVTCHGGNDGAVLSSASGGSGNFTYSWNNGPTTANISGLTANNYVLTVRDNSNCTASTTQTVVEPAAINIAETHNNVPCNATTGGSISLNVSGGNGGFRYLWNGGQTTSSLNNLSANNYSVTVTDASSCTASASINITPAANIVLNETHSDFYCSTTPGSIAVTATVGTAPYIYNWGGGITGSRRTNLSSGSYSVTVTDAANCSAVASITIAQNPALNIKTSKVDATCASSNNGSINTVVTGGTAPFQFRWSNSATTQNITNLAPAPYSLMVTDAMQCSSTASDTINAPSALQITDNVTPVSCYGQATGAIHIIASGGVPTYSYAWNNHASTPDLQNITAGTYTLVVTDANNCSASSRSISVGQAQQIQITGSTSAAGCQVNGSGSVDIQISGGNGGYIYLWNNQAASKNLSSVSAGSYTVTVTDSHNCTASSTFVVASSVPMDISSSVQNASCSTVANGKVELSITGGTEPFTYNWNNGSTGKDLQHITSGTYTLTITDSKNCTSQTSVNVATDYELEAHINSPTTIRTGESMQLTATTNNDFGNSYAWGPANLLACSTCPTTQAMPETNTVFTLTVTDRNGCKAIDSISIEVDPLKGIFIPNAFTPNGDGNNDDFHLYGDIGSLHYLELAIFNRIGEKVFETNDHNFSWDGTYKGEKVQPGAYMYVMKVVLVDGTSKEFKGSVTALR